MTDKDVLGMALTTLKHQSHMIHALSEHVGDPTVLREVSALLQEKQEQRLRVFQAMNQRGWYNPQLVSNQQLQQHKNRLNSLQNQLQQQFGGTQAQPTQQNHQWQSTPGVGTQHATQSQPWSGQFYSSPIM